MNVKHDKTPGQVQEIVIEIKKDDYSENVEKALKKQRREAAVPGFRKGNAPMGIINKMYGKNALVLEIDRIVNEQINKFFEDSKIQYIFEPMPIEDKTKADFDNPGDFTFTYEFALRPEVKIDFKKLPAVTDFTIVASDDEITSYINQLRERHGKYVNPEDVAENDSVSADFGGDKEAFFFIRDLKDDAKKLITGKKVGDKLKLDARKAFVGDTQFARAFNLEVKDLDDEADYNYELTIKRIGRIELAELNEDFFKMAFPNGDITTEDALKLEAKNTIEKQYEPETDRMFMNKAIETLLDNVNVELPDEFMRRYILAVQKDMTQETLEKQFDSFKNSFKWQIIENEIVKGEDVQVTREDIEEYFRDYFLKNYFGNFNQDSVKEQLDKIVQQSMSNQEYVKNAYDMLYDKKLSALLHTKMNIEKKEGDFKAFIDAVYPNNAEEPEKPKKTASKKKTSAKKEEPQAEGEKNAEEKPKKTRKTTKKTDKE